MSCKFYIAFHKSCGQMNMRDVFSLRPYPKVFVFFFLFFLKTHFPLPYFEIFFPVFNDTNKCGGDLNFPPTRLLAGTWEKRNLWFENQMVRAMPFGELQKTWVVI